jgi:hypothetical protein
MIVWCALSSLERTDTMAPLSVLPRMTVRSIRDRVRAPLATGDPRNDTDTSVIAVMSHLILVFVVQKMIIVPHRNELMPSMLVGHILGFFKQL